MSPHATEDEAERVVRYVLPNDSNNPMLLDLQMAWLAVRLRAASPASCAA